MKSLTFPSLLVVALALAPRVAPAAPSDPKAAAAADASGRAHFQRGQRLSARGDYAAAYREFAAGYALTERPLFLFNMAEAARASGDVAKARENYLAFLRADPNSSIAATAQARLAELDRVAGRSPEVTLAPEAREPLPLLPPSATQPSDREAAAPMPFTVERSPERTPVWKKWPFWAVVAGGVVAGGVIVYATSRDGAACAADCSQINFR